MLELQPSERPEAIDPELCALLERHPAQQGRISQCTVAAPMVLATLPSLTVNHFLKRLDRVVKVLNECLEPKGTGCSGSLANCNLSSSLGIFCYARATRDKAPR